MLIAFFQCFQSKYISRNFENKSCEKHKNCFNSFWVGHFDDEKTSFFLFYFLHFFLLELLIFLSFQVKWFSFNILNTKNSMWINFILRFEGHRWFYIFLFYLTISIVSINKTEFDSNESARWLIFLWWF